MTAGKKARLDAILVARGLCDSLEKAQRIILAGQAWVDGQRAAKAGQTLSSSSVVEVRGADRYVSRGGHKLEGALAHFQIAPQGWLCLDVGASTGGFTDCLLQAGAARVVSLDVGEGLLHWKLRQDLRVETREGVNARSLDTADFAERFDLAVADLSFISLKRVLPAVFPLLKPGGRACVLIKPQFEADRDEVGKGGIVRDETVRKKVIEDLRQWLAVSHSDIEDQGVFPSTLCGATGNQEYLWALAKKEQAPIGTL